MTDSQPDDQRATPEALIVKWRETAQKARTAKDRRNDPYDDIGHEYELKAQSLDSCADDLAAALSGSSTAPANSDPEQTLLMHLLQELKPDCGCSVCEVLREHCEETFGGETPVPASAALSGSSTAPGEAVTMANVGIATPASVVATVQEAPICAACAGKGWVSPEDAERGIQESGEMFTAGYEHRKQHFEASAVSVPDQTVVVEPERKIVTSLARLRKFCCDYVADTPIGEERHKFALRVWEEIEAMCPQMTPAHWTAMANSLLTVDSSMLPAASAVAVPSAREWQPIATAPKDGKRVLAWLGPEFVVCVVRWGHEVSPDDGDEGNEIPGQIAWIDDELFAPDPQPSHWMPLPDPPALAALDRGDTR